MPILYIAYMPGIFARGLEMIGFTVNINCGAVFADQGTFNSHAINTFTDLWEVKDEAVKPRPSRLLTFRDVLIDTTDSPQVSQQLPWLVL